MATQLELIQQLGEKKVSAADVAASIGKATPSKRANPPITSPKGVSDDPDPSVSEGASVQLYRLLAQGKISEADYDKVYSALVAK